MTLNQSHPNQYKEDAWDELLEKQKHNNANNGLVLYVLLVK